MASERCGERDNTIVKGRWSIGVDLKSVVLSFSIVTLPGSKDSITINVLMIRLAKSATIRCETLKKT